MVASCRGRPVGAAARARHARSGAARSPRGDVLGGVLAAPRGAARCARSERARTGPRTTSARAIRPRSASGWGCRARRSSTPRTRHLDAAPHLRRFVTKALAMHLADSVWSATERHLFRDATGERHGMPRVGRWYDFTRLPGRARSHTKDAQVGDVSAARHARRPSRRVHRATTAASFSRAACARSSSRRDRGGATTGRSRSCSPACPAARSSCRCGCRPRRRTSPSSTITSPIPSAGTRSIWFVGAIRTPPAAGATRRT